LPCATPNRAPRYGRFYFRPISGDSNTIEIGGQRFPSRERRAMNRDTLQQQMGAHRPGFGQDSLKWTERREQARSAWHARVPDLASRSGSGSADPQAGSGRCRGPEPLNMSVCSCIC
jgi:hypothetical protein